MPVSLCFQLSPVQWLPVLFLVYIWPPFKAGVSSGQLDTFTNFWWQWIQNWVWSSQLDRLFLVRFPFPWTVLTSPQFPMTWDFFPTLSSLGLAIFRVHIASCPMHLFTIRFIFFYSLSHCFCHNKDGSSSCLDYYSGFLHVFLYQPFLSSLTFQLGWAIWNVNLIYSTPLLILIVWLLLAFKSTQNFNILTSAYYYYYYYDIVTNSPSSFLPVPPYTLLLNLYNVLWFSTCGFLWEGHSHVPYAWHMLASYPDSFAWIMRTSF